jgi:hypothetical protein
LSQTLPHPLSISSLSAKRLPPKWNRFKRQTLPNVNRKAFLYEYPLHWALWPQKAHNRTCSSVVYFSSTVTILTAETILWTCACACLLPWLSWIWTVLLPSDTYRKPVTSKTAVLLPFVTCLLSLPRMYVCCLLMSVCYVLRTP